MGEKKKKKKARKAKKGKKGKKKKKGTQWGTIQFNRKGLGGRGGIGGGAERGGGAIPAGCPRVSGEKGGPKLKGNWGK